MQLEEVLNTKIDIKKEVDDFSKELATVIQKHNEKSLFKVSYVTFIVE